MISWNLKHRHCRPIGLDIGHDYIKMIQMSINGAHVNVVAAAKVRVDPDVNGDPVARRNFLIAAIKEMRAGANFRGQNVVSCLPGDELNITSLRLPEAAMSKSDELLRKQVAQRFGLDSEKDSISYLLAGTVATDQEVKNELIVFAADNQVVKNHIEMLEEAGLRPVAIDPIPCALFRNFRRWLRRRADFDRTVVFIDVGSRYTTVVFGRQGEICFAKQIQIGGKKFNQEIASRLGISIDEARQLRAKLKTEKAKDSQAEFWTDEQGLIKKCSFDASTRQMVVDSVTSVAEELAREISLCFRYYTVTFRGKPTEQAIVAGGEAYESILLDVLRKRLTVKIDLAQPLKGMDIATVDFDGDRRGMLCEWAVAAGLGLKGWDGAKMQGGDNERN